MTRAKVWEKYIERPTMLVLLLIGLRFFDRSFTAETFWAAGLWAGFAGLCLVAFLDVLKTWILRK